MKKYICTHVQQLSARTGGHFMSTETNKIQVQRHYLEVLNQQNLSLIDERLGYFQKKINLQRQNAQILLEIVKPCKFTLPSENDHCHRNWFQFALQFQTTQQRNLMAVYLFEKGIDTAKYLDDIATEAKAKYGYLGDCPNAEMLAKTTLLVPIHYSLRKKDIANIAHTINEGSQIF